MKSKRKRKRRIPVCACVTMLLLCMFIQISSVSIYAAENDKETIRIGYIDYDGFFIKGQDDNFTGYGADYLNEIAKYTDWKYEYVYGNWDELMEQLKAGEIDFLCHAQKTEEREKDYLFSKYSDGSESSVLYVRKDDERYYYNDFEHFDGMKIAVMANSYQNKAFKDYADKKKFSFTYEIFGTSEDCFDALQNGDVDAVAMGSLALKSDFKIVCRYGSDPFYFISGKMNESIMDELDDAVGQIQGINPTFQSDLFQKYYGSSISHNMLYTRGEQEYINQSGNIEVGIVDGREPLSYKNADDEAAGMVVDILELIEKKSGLNFTYKVLEISQTGYDFLNTTDAKIVAGVSTSVFTQLNKKLIQSEPLQIDSMVFTARTGEKIDLEDELVVALPDGFINGEEVIHREYPNFKFYHGKTLSECLQAVVDHKADVVISNMYVIRNELRNPRFDSLEMLPTYVFEENVIAVAMPEDEMLLSIINKTVASISDKEQDEIVINNTIAQVYHTTFSDFVFIYRYPLIACCILFIAFVFVCLLFVILKQRKNQQLSEAVKHADSANLAKSQFLARMSHDIRTPMNAIIGLTKLAEENDNLDEVKAYLKNIDESSDLLLGLINDILDMSKIESGELKLLPEPYSITEFRNTITTVMQPLMDKNGIEFIVKLNDTTPCFLIDKLRINQIIFNLLSNAAKFTPRGGKVELSTEPIVEQEVNCDGLHGIRFHIKDTGIGIAEEFLPHIFEAFTQEHTKESDKQKGTGLGLAIVKSLVNAMGGVIKVKSKQGEGTEFIVELHVMDIDEQEEVNFAQKDDYNLEERKVLLVEDNNMNILVAQRLLEKEGCIVTVAKNGKEAVEEFLNSEIAFFDAILMDVRMPELNGIEATKQIRAMTREDAQTVPIIAMTADAFEEEQKKTLEAGMNYHLSKPINPKEMYRILAKYMN